MALIIEDGTIVPGANSYVTVAEADPYLTLMGNGAWALLDQAGKESMLARGWLIVNDGSVYIYDGNRQAVGQEGEWPRTGADYWTTGPVIPPGTIPPEVKRAQIVAAGGLADGSIIWGLSPEQQARLVKSETVDVLSVSYFSPKESAGLAGRGDGGPFAGIGWAPVTGILAPLLDETEYGLAPGASAARRGPRFTRPSYHGIWDIGQNDALPSGDLVSPQDGDWNRARGN